MTILDVPGARLYYEAIGQGPTVLCIPGGNGDAFPWMKLAEQLKDRYTVVVYDRRGFSRSILTDTQDYEHRIERDADDAAALIKHVSGDNGEPAIVIGSSSGAIVTLEVISRHADMIKAALPHEPPAMRFAADYEELWATQQEIYKIYRTGGIVPAMKKFVQFTHFEEKMKDLHTTLDPNTNHFVSSNLQYWFEREFLTYPPRQFDTEKLKSLRKKIILVNGDESSRTAMQYRINLDIAKLLGNEVEMVPGDHFGYGTHAEPFAKKFVEILEEYGKN